MNVSTLAAYCLLGHCVGQPVNVVILHDPERSYAAMIACRMVAVWPWVRSARQVLLGGPEAVDVGDAIPLLFRYPGEPVPDLLPPDTLVLTGPDMDNAEELAFYQEIETHDFELGGVNEWDETIEPSFSKHVLRELSIAHTWRYFPAAAWEDVRRRSTTSMPLQCLDVGCGPISRLRAAAVRGEAYIVGLDPLNDIYPAILARHGYDRLEKIQPDERVTGFAETMSFVRKFDLIFCCNALDHTQNLDAAIQSIGSNLCPGASAIIMVHTKEGERQKYWQLHKYNIWAESNDVFCNDAHSEPRRLTSLDERLYVEKVYRSDDDATEFLLRRRY